MMLKTDRAHMTRAQLLFEIEELPNDAFVTPRHAAALLHTSTGVLANWRSQRRGPSYSGHHDFIRYQIRTLRDWMNQRAAEVSPTGGDADV